MTTPNSTQKAAERIVKLFYLVKQKKSRTLQDALLRTSRYELKEDITSIIEEETRVGEKEEALRVIIPKVIKAERGYPLSVEGAFIVEIAQSALGDKPEPKDSPE